MSTKPREFKDSHKEFASSSPDPVITYDHMEQDSRLKIKHTGDMPVWSFVIEEITIIGLLAALYLSV